MSGSTERLETLRRRAAGEREDLAVALAAARADILSLKQRWRFAGWAASGLAAAAVGGWKLFGRNSLAARVGKIASYASLALGIGRGVQRVRRFF